MKVDPSKPYVLVYCLHPDSELGAIIEPYAVQLNENGTLSLSYQKVYPATTDTFISAIDRTDIAIIKLCSEYSPEIITKKFCKKEVKPQEFFNRYMDEKLLKNFIRPYIEERLGRIIELLVNKPLYLRSKSGNPAQTPLIVSEDVVTVHFHFQKNEEGTKYYPTFRHCGEKLTLLNKNVSLLTLQPCRILMDETVYSFEDNVDGKKLIPFFTKFNIQIPKSSEAEYYKKFIKPLIENHPVIAQGFDVIDVEENPHPILRFEMDWNNTPVLQLFLDYGKEKISLNNPKPNHVTLEQVGDKYTYYKIMRRPELESHFINSLKKSGLVKKEGACFIPSEQDNGAAILTSTIIEWVANNRTQLEEQGFTITQDVSTEKFYLGQPILDMKVEEKNDWFDVYAMVHFGEFKIPFLKLRKYILGDIREFTLPNGKIAILPESWFTKYKDLLMLASEQSTETLKFKKHHFGLIDSIMDNNPTSVKAVSNIKEAIEKFHESEIPLPSEFDSILRPYQKDGYRWLHFLKENNFGGCLADDMGLGKTVQALALLQSINKNSGNAGIEPMISSGQLSIFDTSNSARNEVGRKYPCLIVMPTSLIHNWEFEVKKFAPELKVITYTGLDRADKIKYIHGTDLVLTTYGTVRNDIEIIEKQNFEYIILDESQVIKNPHSKISQAVKRLKARHRLSLTGTPIENSLTDLWSQMSFLNPGMLGSFQLFKDEFVIPIEKKNDPDRRDKLRALIQPFVLRRTKEEVAQELPPMTENVYFCEMSAEQKQLYEDTRNFYRKRILENIEKVGEGKSQFFILKGLMQLRLIANHPRMQDAAFEGESGKFTDIINTLQEVIGGGHKVLVFSQFVRHLELIRLYLIKNEISYSLLTGETIRRREAIEEFRTNEDCKVFLISLKAGGVGLNLTEAEYVFLCDPWWNPAAEKQAINRAHRIGQDKKVFSYKFISKDTVEEKILQLQERKLRLSADFIQPELSATHLISREDVEELFGM